MSGIKDFSSVPMIVSFALLMATTGVSCWGVYRQADNIWRQHSGASVSVCMFTFLGVLQVANLLYGVSLSSAGLVLAGGLRTPFYFAVVWGLWRYKRLAHWEVFFMAVCCIAVGVMAVLPAKQQFYIVFAIGAIFASAMQPYEIWKRKSSGVVSLPMLLSLKAVTLVWVIYAFLFGDAVLIAVALALFLVAVLTIIVWVVYKDDVS